MFVQSCDTMVALGSATANGQTLFAKNSDRPQDEAQPLVLHDRAAHAPGTMTRCQFLELPEARETWRHIGSRPDWCWGYEHGFNEHQVVIGNEGLSSRIESAAPELIGMELLRLGLERGRTAAEAVEVMTDAITRFGQGVFAGMPGHACAFTSRKAVRRILIQRRVSSPTCARTVRGCRSTGAVSTPHV
jgi:secernin